MRRPALLCLILLLAWRAWLGDAMALGTWPAHATTAPTAALQPLPAVEWALAPAAQASPADTAVINFDGVAPSPTLPPPAHAAAHEPARGHAGGPPPCHDSSLPSAAGGDAPTAAHASHHAQASADGELPSHGGTCTACQICHLAWFSPQAFEPALPGQRFATPHSVQGGFQSACLNPQLKPPIA